MSLDLRDVPGAGEFRCILADPPWAFRTYSEKGRARSADRHYRTMSISDIKALPVGDVAAADAWLFMWTSSPYLDQVFSIMRRWGFRYSSIFLTWVKLNPTQGDQMFTLERDFHLGMGRTSRKNTEIMLLGKRGKPPVGNNDIRELLLAARREHSRKPDESFARVERFCAGPRLEMFSREDRPGWTTWGLEAGKRNAVPAPASCPIELPDVAPAGPPPKTPMFG